MSLELRLVKYAEILKGEIWYTGKELSKKWDVIDSARTGIIAHLVKRNMLKRKGATSTIQYKLVGKEYWQLKHSPNLKKAAKKIEKTGNGVIDAKLRKEAGLLAVPSALEELIEAATKIGSENESLKQALREIKTTIAKVQEYL